mmetsp:Transcript_84205/g.216787  ORF Transcript_84205/g.216787 Transcript_84205/m.216787 type:complete len:711 (-) Transcript_84205:71-2203(-)
MLPCSMGGALLAALLGLHTACALRAVRNAATPVEKVVDLLGRLEAQVTDEGAKEATEYDKYACFCKEEADDKQYAVQRSNETVAKLDAHVRALAAEIAALDAEALQLGQEIDALATNISDEKEARKTDHDNYLTADENVTTAIKAVDDAIRELKGSKSKMAGSAKLDLAQVASAASAALLAARPTSDAQVKAVTALVRAAKQDPPKYAYRSNRVLSTLEDLGRQFREHKQERDKVEAEAQATSDKKVLAWSNEKKFKEKAKLEKEKLSAEKGTKKGKLETEMQEETIDMNADVAFRTELTAQCEQRAEEWDQRSQVRAGELTALAEAREILASGVAKNYGANKKLVGLAAKGAQVLKARPKATAAAKKGAAPSLLQLAAHSAGGQAAAVHSAVQRLGQLAQKLGSPVLSALAAKAELQEDHFVKVRGLINDLIARLEAQALDEASQKSFCDTEMASAISDRDAHSLTMEEESATITEQESLKAQLQQDIALLSEEIAELQKALNEATELRQMEKASNAKTVADAQAGKSAVEQAISVLEAFYSAAAGGQFVQYQPPGGDRAGRTVGDYAPEMSYSGDYNGKQGASNGIIGLLNVILSDFDRTEGTVGSEEIAAAGAFMTFETETTDSVDAKKKLVADKEGEIVAADGAITNAKDALMTAKRLRAGALAELEKLQVMCVDGEESYEERRKKRKQEIEALKEALNILENWKE